MPTPAHLAIFSSDASMPQVAKASPATSSRRSRLRQASARCARAITGRSPFRPAAKSPPQMFTANPLTKRRVPPVCFPEAASASDPSVSRRTAFGKQQIGTLMTTATVSAPAAPASGRDRRWLALAVIGVAQLMIILDASIVNIALPHAQKALHISDASRQWALTAYTLTFGGLLLLGGRIGDYLGRKRTLLIG